MTDPKLRAAAARRLDIPLDRDVFTRTLIRELAGALEDVIGIGEASGYIIVVGSAIGGSRAAEDWEGHRGRAPIMHR
jgi:hypothetical protein